MESNKSDNSPQASYMVACGSGKRARRIKLTNSAMKFLTRTNFKVGDENFKLLTDSHYLPCFVFKSDWYDQIGAILSDTSAPSEADLEAEMDNEVVEVEDEVAEEETGINLSKSQTEKMKQLP